MTPRRSILLLTPRTAGCLSGTCVLLAFLNAIWLPLPFAFSMLLLIIGVLLWGIYLSSVGEEGKNRYPIAGEKVRLILLIQNNAFLHFKDKVSS